MASEEELRATRRAKVERLVEAGSQGWPNDLRVDEATEEGRRWFVELARDESRRAELPDEVTPGARVVRLYGRVVAKRGPFLVLRTPYGDAQALVRKNELPDEQAACLKAVDLGDHAVVEGSPIRTRSGDAAVSATRYAHVSKALLPPPEKWHGLKDVEKRYRERYVDLWANPEVAEVFRARTTILRELRRFLDDRGYLEVETPVLQPVRGGATARPFRTHHNVLDLPLYLRIAPELYLKRLLVGGFDRVYEVARTFRNEGISTRHNPEFTLLELYRAYATYEDLMDLTQEMFRHVSAAVRERHPRLADACEVDLGCEYARVPMRRAIVDRIAARDGVPPSPFSDLLSEAIVMDEERLARATAAICERLPEADAKHLERCRTYGERVYALFELVAEPDLTRVYRSDDGARSRPVFVTEYPFEVSPLSRRSDADPRFVDRFELFVDGRELVNAFSELNDPEDQAARFERQLEAREGGDEEAMDFDADYVRALSYGMPPAAGFGLGVDRFVMAVCGQPSIRDVLLFPLLRPEGG